MASAVNPLPDVTPADMHALNVVGAVLERLRQEGQLAKVVRAPMFVAEFAQFPVAFFSQGVDRRHQIIGHRDEEVEGSVRIELLGRAMQLDHSQAVKGTDMVNLVSLVRRRLLLADAQLFTDGSLAVPVEIDGLPITTPPINNPQEGLSYAELTLLWMSGVNRI